MEPTDSSISLIQKIEKLNELCENLEKDIYRITASGLGSQKETLRSKAELEGLSDIKAAEDLVIKYQNRLSAIKLDIEGNLTQYRARAIAEFEQSFVKVINNVQINETIELEQNLLNIKDDVKNLIDLTAEKVNLRDRTWDRKFEDFKRRLNQINMRIENYEREKATVFSIDEVVSLKNRVFVTDSKSTVSSSIIINDIQTELKELQDNSSARFWCMNSGWLPDSSASTCEICDVLFSSTIRKHHCRLCGHIFCSECACLTLKLGRISDPALKREEKVCFECFMATKKKIIPESKLVALAYTPL